jgi:Peptidase C39 family
MALTKFKQTNDYNCAVYAVAFFLNINGITPRIAEIERKLKPSPETGTAPDKIVKYLRTKSLDVDLFHDLKVMPAIVNYQYDEDGHYSVMIWCDKGKEVCLFNPYTAWFERIKYYDFKAIWYSERYGRCNAIRIVK